MTTPASSSETATRKEERATLPVLHLYSHEHGRSVQSVLFTAHSTGCCVDM